MHDLDYITLKEAEKLTGIKADTLKKRCQEGQIRGAIKQGKTWFVPRDELIQLPHVQQDAALRMLAVMAESGVSFPITILVKGMYIAGVTVDHKRYYKHLRDSFFKGFDSPDENRKMPTETLNKIKDALDKNLFERVNEDKEYTIRHLHLSTYVIPQSGNSDLTRGAYLRVKISSIDGFAYGAMDTLIDQEALEQVWASRTEGD